MQVRKDTRDNQKPDQKRIVQVVRMFKEAAMSRKTKERQRRKTAEETAFKVI